MSTLPLMSKGPGSAPSSPGSVPQDTTHPKAYHSTSPGDHPPPSPQNNNTNMMYDFGFNDRTIRHDFLRKVYSILVCQLIITILIVAAAIFHQPTALFVKEHAGLLYIVGAVSSIGILIALSCVESLRRNSPINFILLWAYTFSVAAVISTITLTYPPETILMALGITAVLCFALTIFAFQTKIDFTVMGGFLLVATIGLIVVCIVAMFFPSKLFSTIISSAGAILFSVYLIYDTQLMIGGEHKYSISPEEYVYASISLFIDIINIFLFILHLLGGTQSD